MQQVLEPLEMVYTDELKRGCDLFNMRIENKSSLSTSCREFPNNMTLDKL